MHFSQSWCSLFASFCQNNTSKNAVFGTLGYVLCAISCEEFAQVSK